MSGLHLRNLRGDFYGGITAAVVALPLALALGVASGAGPVAGVYGAIFVGFFAALFGGTPSQVSGPTGPMTVVMAGIITQYAHEPALAFTVVIMAGLFQIGFGVLKLGRYVGLMPYPVISGFMSGIGCIIIILQIAPLLGAEPPAGGPLQALMALPETVSGSVLNATIAGVIAFGIAMFLPDRINRVLPSPLMAHGVGTVLVLTLLPGAPVLGEIPTGLPAPQLPTFELAVIPDMVQSALVLAFLGSIDSLLTSLIADNVTHTHHDSDRELIGQGIGNTIAGLMGGIPGAGATMRTVINVRAGGRTPLSGALHALVLLAVMLGLGRYASHIPHAVLAGILMKVGIDIIDWDYLGRIRRAPTAGVVFMFVVLALTVFVDLITAVGVGIVMASLLFVKRMADLQLQSVRAIAEPTDEEAPLSEAERQALARGHGHILLVHLGGPMSFGAANGMVRQITSVEDYRVLVLDLSDAPFMDSSAAMAIETTIHHTTARGRDAVLVGLGSEVTPVLERMGILDLLGPGHQFDNRLDALERAVELIEAQEQSA